MGAAYGIGKLAASAVESMARQPEMAGKITTTAIVLAALIEGFTFYGIIQTGTLATGAVSAEEKAAAARTVEHK
jgi:ATP synthase F0 subunit c